jgi:hypothetical protein
LRVSVFVGLLHRPSPITDGEPNDIGSRFQSVGTVMTLGGAVVAGEGETAGVAAGTGVAGSDDGVGDACATSAEMRNACANANVTLLPCYQG